MARTPKGELAILRTSLRRVAQEAIRQGADLRIPEPGTERGWNWLCADLITWLVNTHDPRTRGYTP